MAITGIANSKGGHTTATTSHSVTLPADVQQYDTMVLVGAIAASQTVSGLPTGWSAPVHQNDGSNGVRLFWTYKICDGTEADFSFNTSSTSALAYVIYKARYGDTVNVPEGALATTTFTSNKNPPNLAPAPGAGEYLWIAGIVTRGSTTPTVRPTGFTASYDQGTAYGHEIYTDYLIDTLSSSKDPSIYTSTNTWYVAFTIAMPAGTGPAPVAGGAETGQLARSFAWRAFQVRVKSGGTGGTLGVSAVAE